MDKEKMTREGWQESSITGGSHLEHWKQMYEEMGFEVYLEKVDINAEKGKLPHCGASCRICYDEASETPYRIYTRLKPRPAAVSN